MKKSNQYFAININKAILKRIIKYIFISIGAIVIYFLVSNVIFLRDTGLPYTPAKRWGLTLVLDYAFGEMLYKCENKYISNEEKEFFDKYQVFDSKIHDLKYLFGMGRDNCLSIQADGESPVIPYLPIWYKNTDPIKISLSNIKILEDSYVLSKILEISKHPCQYIPPKKELLAYYETSQKKDIHWFSSLLKGYIYARTALECDIETPKNEKVQLWFYDGTKLERRKTAITLELQRQGK